MAKTREEVIAQIEQAFADAVYPHDERIAFPSWGTDEIQIAFQGKNWKDLTDVRFLRIKEDALAFLKPESFRYFLPAFMLAALNDPKTADIILDGLEFHLTPPDAVVQEAWLDAIERRQLSVPAMMERFLRKVRGFSPAQKKAIHAYLDFYFHSVPEGYWDDYMPEKIQQQKNVLQFWQTFEG